MSDFKFLEEMYNSDEDYFVAVVWRNICIIRKPTWLFDATESKKSFKVLSIGEARKLNRNPIDTNMFPNNYFPPCQSGLSASMIEKFYPVTCCVKKLITVLSRDVHGIHTCPSIMEQINKEKTSL